MLTSAEAHELLTYDPETGEFRWKIHRHKHRAGTLAGTLGPKGYWRIKTGGVSYGTGRLAVLMMTGEWPTAQVDHRDLDKSNHRWLNLRVATMSQNRANVAVRKHSRSGLKGVSMRRNGTFQAHIRKDGQRVHLGTFKSDLEAHAAYVAAAQRLHGVFFRAA